MFGLEVADSSISTRSGALDLTIRQKKRFFVKCCGVNNKEAYLDWIKNEKVLNPVLTF